MSEEEPTRIGEDASASDALRGAIDAAREDWPGEHELASLEARLGPLLGPGGGGGGGGAPSPGIGGAGVGLAAKVLGVLAVTAALSGIAWWSLGGDETPARPTQATFEQAAMPERPEDAPAEQAAPRLENEGSAQADPGDDATAQPLRVEERRPARRRALAPRSPAASAPPAEIDPEAELALLREAQDALGPSPARALALTDAHRNRFGTGVLAQEREVVAIDALLRLGRREAARARAAAFHARWPRSAHGRRVEVLVAP